MKKTEDWGESVMDEEIEGCAELALLNAFWRDFSALVNAYMEAGRGLNADRLESGMSSLTSVFGRDFAAEGDHMLNIWTQDSGSRFSTPGHETLVGALQHANAEKIYLRGDLIFERDKGEWYFLNERASKEK